MSNSDNLSGYEQQISDPNFPKYSQHQRNFEQDYQLDDVQPLSNISIQYTKGDEMNYGSPGNPTSRYQQVD